MTLPPLFENNSVLSLITISMNEPSFRKWSKRPKSQTNSNSFGFKNRIFRLFLFVTANGISQMANEFRELGMFVEANAVLKCEQSVYINAEYPINLFSMPS